MEAQATTEASAAGNATAKAPKVAAAKAAKTAAPKQKLEDAVEKCSKTLLFCPFGGLAARSSVKRSRPKKWGSALQR